MLKEVTYQKEKETLMSWRNSKTLEKARGVS